MNASVGQWLATDAAARPPRSYEAPRTRRPSSQTAKAGTGRRTEALSPCHPACPICTEPPTPADRWDLPWPAYRWSPELEAS